ILARIVVQTAMRHLRTVACERPLGPPAYAAPNLVDRPISSPATSSGSDRVGSSRHRSSTPMAMRGTSRFAATESLAYADADRTGVIHGRLGRKDLYGWRADNVPDRLTPPLVRENGR